MTIKGAGAPGAATVSWNPKAFPAVGGPSTTRVAVARTGHQHLEQPRRPSTPTAGQYLMEALDPATTYDFEVSPGPAERA